MWEGRAPPRPTLPFLALPCPLWVVLGCLRKQAEKMESEVVNGALPWPLLRFSSCLLVPTLSSCVLYCELDCKMEFSFSFPARFPSVFSHSD